ncbi:hypothetical protein B0H15DRAFT_947542 [Mycena belliarum]|uniref:Uncharacterized protein n=1 Tax=Mycena belliarum TaxID=1033014 RepID=A0AAD6XR80_9AGAR|nr:hypothetical protein B0H15DRAFT_947542 [Mycena belliae]
MPLSWAQMGVASNKFDPSYAFVTSPFLPTSAFATLRIIFALYLLSALCVDFAFNVRDGNGESFLSYFTHLSYIGLTAYYIAAAVQTLAYARWGSYPLRSWGKGMQAAHVLLQSMAITFPFLVTVVFWALLASANTFATPSSAWSNISFHALNSAFALVELFLGRSPPAPLIALVVQLLCLAGYLGVAYITRATQGFYTYTFLDPQVQHAFLAAYIVGIAVGAVLVYFITRSVAMLRVRLTRRPEGIEGPRDMEKGRAAEDHEVEARHGTDIVARSSIERDRVE